MRPANLKELPPPPKGRSGWPWNEESAGLPGLQADGSPWTRITVVTPSFNQGEYLEETLRSVLLQGYPNLEYFVLDGGSTDESVEIIRRYSPWLDFWISQPDGGQSAAISRGLRMATGELATWINSDDGLCKDALRRHVMEIEHAPDTVYVGLCQYIDQAGGRLREHRSRVHSLEDLLNINDIWRAKGHIVQPEVLFPRELALAVGGLDVDDHRTMDFQLWGRLLMGGATIVDTNIPIGRFRLHAAQKTHDRIQQTEALLDSAEKLVSMADCLSEEKKIAIRARLGAYRQRYPQQHWRGTGRLARLGLPRHLVSPLRRLKSMVWPIS